MLDLILLAGALAFFALAIGYVVCLRPALRESTDDLRLLACRPRHGGAPRLPHLRSAAPRALLKRSSIMTINGWIQIAIYFAILTALVVPLDASWRASSKDKRTFLSPVLRPVEVGALPGCGVDEKREQHWITYTIAMLLFNVGGFSFCYFCSASRRCCRSIRRHVGRGPDTFPSIPPSASSPTPTGRTTAARAR